MKFINDIVVYTFLLVFLSGFAQEKKKFKVHTIAFYNLENLFDTINDPNKFDEASPIMEMKVDIGTVYKKKIHNMARVLADIGSEVTRNTPAIIGVSEIENRKVLEDLVNDPLLLPYDYGIIHFDSPDVRGIDVAFLYKKAIFQPLYSSNHELELYDDQTRKRVYTRDQLLVSGNFDGEPMHFIVNHWPSRRGGEAKSRPKRVAAAKLNKHLIDSLQVLDPYAKVFTMGDLNDDPINTSIKEVLKAKRNKKDVKLKGIYNPMENMARQGLGSNAYRDAWSLFDQILFTQPLLEKDYSTYRFYRAGIYNRQYLTNRHGRFKGYPLRSFADGGFTDGFSDHFPVYAYIIKEIN